MSSNNADIILYEILKIKAQQSRLNFLGEQEMFNRLYNDNQSQAICMNPEADTYSKRLKRNSRDDIKIAIDLLFEFRNKLEELHPLAIDVVNKLMQQEKY